MLTATKTENPTLDFSTKEAALQTLATIEHLHLTGVDLTRALPKEHPLFPCETPLYIACKLGDVKAAAFLIDKVNIDPNNNSELPKIGRERSTPASIAASRNQVDILKLLHARKVASLYTPPFDYLIPIYEACKNGAVDAVLFLLDFYKSHNRPVQPVYTPGTIPNYSVDNIIDMLVPAAVNYNQVAVLKLLLQKGCHPPTIIPVSHSSHVRTSFDYAYCNSRFEVAEFIFSLLPTPCPPHGILSIFETIKRKKNYFYKLKEREMAFNYLRKLIAIGLKREVVFEFLVELNISLFEFYTPLEKYLALHILNSQSRLLLEQLLTKAKSIPKDFECIIQINQSGEQVSSEQLPHYLAVTIESLISKLTPSKLALALPLKLDFYDLLKKYQYVHQSKIQPFGLRAATLSADEVRYLETVLHNLLVINNQFIKSISSSNWFQEHTDDISVSIHKITAELDPMETEQDLEEIADLDPKDDQPEQLQDNPKEEVERSPTMLMGFKSVTSKPQPLRQTCPNTSKGVGLTRRD